jgi:hypothetical protein
MEKNKENQSPGKAMGFKKEEVLEEKGGDKQD